MKINVWQYREDRRRKELSAASTIQKWYRATSKGNETRAWYKYAFTEAQRIIARGGDKDTVHLMRYIRNNKKKQRKELERRKRAALIIQRVVRKKITFCGMPNMSSVANTTPENNNDIVYSTNKITQSIGGTFINVMRSLLVLGSYVSITAGSSRITTRGCSTRTSRLLMVLVVLINMVSAEALSIDRGTLFNCLRGLATCACLGSSTCATLMEVFTTGPTRSKAARAAKYPTKVLQKIESIIHEWFTNNDDQYLSTGAPRIRPSVLDHFCNGIANTVFERDPQDNTKFVNADLIQEIIDLYNPAKDSDYNQVTDRVSLVNIMKLTLSGQSQSYLGYHLSNLRKGDISGYAKAEDNETKGRGPFERYAVKGDRDTMRRRINGLVAASASTSQARQEDLHNEADARAIVHYMLRQRNLQYLLDYTVPQLMAMVVADVKGFASLTKAEQFLNNPNKSFNDVELNVIVAKMDYIIKTKATLELIIPKIMDGTAIHLDLYDRDEKKIRRDIYLMVSIIFLLI